MLSHASDLWPRRGLDDSFPGVHPDDLDRCLEIDAFDFALGLEQAGTLLEPRPISQCLEACRAFQ